MSQKPETHTNRLLRLPEVIEKTGIKRSSIYRMIVNGEFPSPIKIGERSSAWVNNEVEQWIENRIERSRLKGRSS